MRIAPQLKLLFTTRADQIDASSKRYLAAIELF